MLLEADDVLETTEELAETRTTSRWKDVAIDQLGHSLTLGEILEILDDNDTGLIDLSNEILAVLGSNLMSKIDGCAYRIDSWDAIATLHRKYAATFAASARALEAKGDRLKSRILFNMKLRQFEQLPGEKFKVKITSSQSLAIKDEATSSLCVQYPDFIKRSYAWDKRALTAAVKQGSTEIEGLNLSLETKESIRFSPNKQND